MTQLSPRQQSIFFRVVDTHIDTAQPVGSKFITELYEGLYRGSYSSATVRHEMGHLEDMGYLTHPHTSAGRIPTDRGYRYYVDNGHYEDSDSEESLDDLDTESASDQEDADYLGETICQRLSELTEELAVVVLPGNQASRFKVFTRGSACILEKPEFQNTQKAKMVFTILENTILLRDILSQSIKRSERASVSIGQENGEEALRDCSIVASMFQKPKSKRGVVAIIGPKRMRYARSIAVVSKMARVVGRFF